MREGNVNGTNGNGLLGGPKFIGPKARAPSGWDFAGQKWLLLISQEVSLKKAWNSLVHSTALNNLPIKYFFFFFAIWCRNLACGSHLGCFLSLGQTPGPSRMAPKMGHLYLSLLLGFSFLFLFLLLGPPSRHLCHCLGASPPLRKIPSSPGSPALICDDIRHIRV